jgi:hypothetical protein
VDVVLLLVLEVVDAADAECRQTEIRHGKSFELAFYDIQGCDLLAFLVCLQDFRSDKWQSFSSFRLFVFHIAFRVLKSYTRESAYLAVLGLVFLDSSVNADVIDRYIAFVRLGKEMEVNGPSFRVSRLIDVVFVCNMQLFQSIFKV